jgi:hypothetical protein
LGESFKRIFLIAAISTFGYRQVGNVEEELVAPDRVTESIHDP